MPTRFANTIDNDPIYALRAMCDKNGLDFTQYYAKLTDLPAAQVQADWSVSDPTSMAFIKNKPDLSVFALSSSLATVATSGSYNDLLNKPTIPAAQVQSDYGQADSNAVDFIKNKPDLSVYARSNDLAAVATTGDYDDLLNKPSIPAAQVQSDWNQSDSGAVEFIKNKPNIPAAPVQSNWNESDNTSLAYILNKPDIANVPAVTSNDDGKVLKASYSDGTGSYSWETESGGSSLPASTSADEGKVLTVDSSGDPQWSDVPEELYIFTTGTAATDATNIAAAITAGKKVILRIQDGSYYYDLPLAFWRATETFKFAGWVDSYREFIKTLDYADSAWTWSSTVKKTIVPDSTSIDAGKVLTVGSNGKPQWQTGSNPLPASTSADEGKVLTVDSSGDPQWDDLPEGTPENVMLTYGTSTWADFTAALATNSVIFCDIGDGKYAVMTWKGSSTIEFQYVRTVNDTQWPLSSNGYNCEVYKYTLDSSNNWTTAAYPVAFKPVTGNGIKLYDNANRELQFAVDIPVYTDGNNSILWLGANGSLSIASSLFASKSITKTYTSPKAGGPVYTSTGSTSSSYFAIGNRYNNDCDQTFDNETIEIAITGDISSSMEADRTKLIRWNSSTSLTLDGDLSVKYGLFYYDTFQTSTPFKAAAEPKLIVELKDCGTLLAANRYLSGIFMHPPLTKTVNNVIIPKGAKFLTAFYTVVGGVQYFFGAMLNPYGNANLSITSTMTGSVATLISVPASTSADAGKVLTVDSSGDPEWATPSSSQSQADWNQSDSTAADYIKNKPGLANVATSGSYNDLSDKPTIPSLFNYTVKSVSNTGSGTNHRMVINENYPVKYQLNGGYNHDTNYRDLNIRENSNAMKNDWIATASGTKNYTINIYDSNNTLSTRYTFVYFNLSLGTSGISTGGSVSVSGNYAGSTVVIRKTGSLITVYVN